MKYVDVAIIIAATVALARCVLDIDTPDP